MLTSEQILQKYGKTRLGSTSQPSPAPSVQKSPGNLQRFLTDFGNVLSKTASNVKSELSGVLTSKLSGPEALQKGANIAGELAAGAGDLVFGTTSRAAFHALPTEVQSGLKEGAGNLAREFYVPEAMQAYGSFKEQHPLLAKNVENLANIASIVPGGKAVGLAEDVASQGAKKTISTLGNIRTLSKEASVAKVVERRVNELTKLESRNASLRKAIQSSSEKGIDVKRTLAETDLLKDAIDKSGVIRTTQEGGAVSQLQDFIRPQEQVVSKVLREEGKSINLSEVEKVLKQSVHNSGLQGGALTRAIKNVDDDIAGYALKADGDGNIPLGLVQDAKIDKYRNINYLNPEASRADKAIGRGLKEIIENNTTSANVKALNQELSKHYAVLGLLEKLDGKIVAGGKLGKYFANTVGAVVGSHFGPLGAIAGAEIGGALKGASMARKFRGTTGKALEQSDAMKSALGSVPKRQPPKLLGPGPMVTPPPKDVSRLFSQEEARARLSELGQVPVNNKTMKFVQNNPVDKIQLKESALHDRVMSELIYAKAGERYRTGDGGFSGSKSTFPNWIPEELRHKPLLDKVANHIQNGTLPTTPSELRLYQIVADEMRAMDDVLSDAAFIAQQRANVVIPFATDAENAAALAKFDAEIAKLKGK